MSHPTLLEAPPKPMQQLGRYCLLEVLGQGGMGTVHLAVRDAPSEPPALYALKLLRPELAHDARHLDMFMREAELASRLSHPNVVRTLEAGEADGQVFLAMEFLDGQPLHLLLGRAGEDPPLPLHVRVQIVCDALRGLDYVHQLRADGRPLPLLHRDVSPNNLFVTYDGQVKLLDFGVAKLALQGDTGSGDFKGKLGYAAPERFVGAQIDARSDVFAAGVTLWEAIALRRFASGPPTRAFVDARLHGRELPITCAVPDLEPELAAICNRALQVDPNQRFPSAEALRRALHGYLAKRHATVERAALGGWMRLKFSAERNALHQRINAQLRSARAPSAPHEAPRAPTHSFIRKRPSSAPHEALAPARRGRRHVAWFMLVLLLALGAAVVHAAT
ncbi:MAG TPA: serine/threonine-protein kinase [Polyangiales bacterium]